MHQTDNVYDNYLGSGMLLRKAVEKYGRENFKKDILFVYDNEIEMRNKEKELVNETFVASDNNYNIAIGGKGNFSHINNNNLNGSRKGVETQAVLREDENWCNWHKSRQQAGLKSMSPEKEFERQRKRVETMKNGSGFASFKGRKHTEETLERMRAFQKGRHTGENNSQYGTMWITNGTVNKKVKKDIDILPEGFYKGMVTKK